MTMTGNAINKQIEELNALGQSIWYDNLSRDVLKTGELAGLIAQGVSGLTSNPTIFKKAIADSDHYDQALQELKAQGLNQDEACEVLMIKDVAEAADLLRPIYDQTKGADGYASIEVSPLLATDGQATIAAGQRIWKALSRPNIMIKVPATPESLPAIPALLEQGINVNVTLIFSTTVYRKVAQAYAQALQNRVKAGLPVDRIASVASFFVSRVDAICEKEADKLVKAGKLDAQAAHSIAAKIGIANSKEAYAAFEEIFGSPEFKALEDKGAMVQRPLWASTGTKNPAYSPVLYIEQLAGRDTVNTVPPATLTALLKGAEIKPRLHDGLSEARKQLASLEGMGLVLDDLLNILQREGVASFIESYEQLVQAVGSKLRS